MKKVVLFLTLSIIFTSFVTLAQAQDANDREIIAEGIIAPAPNSIWQYGTHVLLPLDRDATSSSEILFALVSNEVDLDAYINQPVKIKGLIEPLDETVVVYGPALVNVLDVMPLDNVTPPPTPSDTIPIKAIGTVANLSSTADGTNLGEATYILAGKNGEILYGLISETIDLSVYVGQLVEIEGTIPNINVDVFPPVVTVTQVTPITEPTPTSPPDDIVISAIGVVLPVAEVDCDCVMPEGITHVLVSHQEETGAITDMPIYGLFSETLDLNQYNNHLSEIIGYIKKDATMSNYQTVVNVIEAKILDEPQPTPTISPNEITAIGEVVKEMPINGNMARYFLVDKVDASHPDYRMFELIADNVDLEQFVGLVCEVTGVLSNLTIYPPQLYVSSIRAIDPPITPEPRPITAKGVVVALPDQNKYALTSSPDGSTTGTDPNVNILYILESPQIDLAPFVNKLCIVSGTISPLEIYPPILIVETISEVNEPTPDPYISARGIIEKLDASTWMYGTHVLVGAANDINSREVLYALVSQNINLDAYVGYRVEIQALRLPGYPISFGPPLVEVVGIKILDPSHTTPTPTPEPREITAAGVIEAMEQNMWQYGTHILVEVSEKWYTSRNVLYALSSDSIDLDRYIGKLCKVKGVLVPMPLSADLERPDIVGPILINVTEVTVIEEPTPKPTLPIPTPDPNAPGEHLFIPEVVACPGLVVPVPVILVQSKNTIDAFGFVAEYDSSLIKFNGIARTNLTKGFEQLEAIADPENGTITIGGYDVDGGIQAGTTDTLVVLWFVSRFNDYVKINTAGTICIDNYVDDLAGSNAVCGKYKVGDCNYYLRGDVNGDNEISPGDALICFSTYLGMHEPYESAALLCDERCAADFNLDDSVTPSDALCIFKEYLGLICE